jgi:hypothetical protein
MGFRGLLAVVGNYHGAACAPGVGVEQGEIKMMNPRVVGVVIPLVVVISANAGVIRHDVNDSAYQAYGNQSQFDSVGLLTMTTSIGTRLCSSTLINEQWALTAAHCFDGVPVLSSSFAALGNGGFAFSSIAEVVVHPDWIPGTFTTGSDLALVRLSQPVPNFPVAGLYTGSNELGLLGSSIGYGATGTGLTGDVPGSFGTKRGGTNDIDILGSSRGWNENILVTDFDNPINEDDSLFGSNIPTDLEIQVGAGDSGGALFIQEGGVWTLAGVTSFIASADGSPDADYGDMSAYTRVSAYADWINSVIPAPGTVGVFTLAGVIAGRRRRVG